jgi:hypothetical protein
MSTYWQCYNFTKPPGNEKYRIVKLARKNLTQKKLVKLTGTERKAINTIELNKIFSQQSPLYPLNIIGISI